MKIVKQTEHIMDEISTKFINDCFLRPVSDPRTTNAALEAAPSKVTLKAEMQVLRLSDESQKLTMETLRRIHGDDFKLDEPTKYKDRGGHMKKSYWQERGTLIVRGVTSNYSKTPEGENERSTSDPEDRLRRFALLKLENYGFPMEHCIEAYDYCEGETDKALELLFRKYMRVQCPAEENKNLEANISAKDLLDLREDERSSLESIYDNAFEVKEQNNVWSLKFQIEHLLKHSPSETRKQNVVTPKATKNETSNGKRGKPRCRNFDKNGVCKFGSNCRFAHIARTLDIEKKTKGLQLDENDNEKWFYLEVRFPHETKYPYEAPFIYLKTTCHDIPRDVLLRVSRMLYREACTIAHDGMPSVYTISEQLQTDESITQLIAKDRDSFPDPKKSLFFVEAASVDNLDSSTSTKPLPTHYERGQTAHGDGGLQRTPAQIEREDRNLMRTFLERQTDEYYRSMMAGRQKLPAFSKMMDILGLMEKSQVIVVSGETGCGKSTQVPQFILDNWLFKSSKLRGVKMPHVEVICTQPRRLSAIGVAERVSDERAERIGQIVGYQIRLENKISHNTRLTFCTTGILLRRLASDPLLRSITHVVVDEVHERSEESDFLLMILKGILQKRNDLRVILMSATMNAKLFSDYFGEVPVLDIPGRTFPVEQFFLGDILEMCNYVMEYDSPFSRKFTKKEEEELMRELEYADIRPQSVAPANHLKDEDLHLPAIYARYCSVSGEREENKKTDTEVLSKFSKKTCKTIYLMDSMKINTDLIECALRFIVEGEHSWPREGTILVFLPGLQEIQAVHEALSDSALFRPRSGNFVLIPLHSNLSSEEQSAVFRPAPAGKRKIVLSTNIAETSVTIEDCVFVVDYGLMKEKRFDSNRNMESLDLVWVSRANAMQRKGRAGRVMPGICFHLYTEHRYRYNLLAQPVPEIHRVPLEQLLLRIKTLKYFDGENLVEVLGRTLEPPTENSIVSAVNRLQDVGALDECQNLTPLGHHLSALPVDVRIGKLMLFGAIFQCLDSVLTIAACLSHKSPFVSPFTKRIEADRSKREFAICNSDHLTVLVAYKKWLEVSKRSYFASRNYAEEHFLSLKTLQTISEVKYQFLELLVSIGFVPVNVPKKRKNSEDNVLELTGHGLNLNGSNNPLLISLLCAALYPNIVKILSPERSYIQTAGGAMPKVASAKDFRFKTKEDGFVAIHPSSVNSDVSYFQSAFLVYQGKVKTSRIFVRECSMLPLVPLVLFAGSDLKIELHGGDFLFLIEDGWIIIKADDHKTAEMIQCLRLELQKILAEKIRDPCLNLLHHENGRNIIHNIVYLIGHNN